MASVEPRWQPRLLWQLQEGPREAIRFGLFTWQVPRWRNVYAKIVRLCASRRVGPLWFHRENSAGVVCAIGGHAPPSLGAV